jgi:hypothetical protein
MEADLFITVYRVMGFNKQRVYHKNPSCYYLSKAAKIRKTRLGSVLAAGYTEHKCLRPYND